MVVLASFLAYRLLPGGSQVPLHIFVPLWALAFFAAIVAWFLPWQTLLESWAGRWALYAWSVADIVLVTVLIAWVPKEGPTLFAPYILTTLFFSLFYTRRSQIMLFAFTSACYVGLFLAGQSSVSAGDLVLRLGLLGGVALIASFAATELTSGMIDALASKAEAERDKTLYETLLQAQSDLGEGVAIAQLSSRRITYANDAYCRIVGYEREELLQMSYMDLLVPAEVEVARGLEAARRDGAHSADYDRDFTVLRKDGHRAIIDVVSKQLSDDFVVSVIRDVTKQRIAQEELRGREELFRAVSELTSDFVYSVRIEPGGLQTWEWATDGFRAVTGYSIEDPEIHDGWIGLLHPQHVDAARDAYREVLRSGGGRRVELSIRARSGEQRLLDVSADAVYDESKQRITRIFGSAQDITEKRRAEGAVEDRAEVLGAISELTSDYVYAVRFEPDGQMKWQWVSDGFRTVTGYEPHELEGIDGWMRLIHPEDLEESVAALSGLTTDPSSSIHLRHRIVSKEGPVKNIETHARAAVSEDGTMRIYGAVQDVSERKQVEEALRESEQRYRELFDRMPVGLFVRQYDGSGRDANPACLEMFGYPDRETFISTPAEDFYVDPDERIRFMDWIESEDRQFETEFRRFDGSTFWGRILARVVNDDEGRPAAIEGVIADVTQERNVNIAVQRSLSLLRSTIESTWDGILVVATNGDVVTFNQRLLEMWGLDEKTLAQGDFEALTKVLNKLQEPKVYVERVAQLYDEPARESFDIFELKDGRVFERYSRPQVQDEEIVGRVWSFRDVTERRENARQLQESLSLLETTLEAVAEGILVVDREGQIVTYNSRFAEMWDIPEDVLRGSDRETVIQMAATRTNDPAAFVDSVRASGRATGDQRVELIELVDGRLLERFTREAVAEDIGRVISFRDITQRRELEEQLRQAQKMEAVGRLAGGVAHDFNNLLTAILGYCEMLKDDPSITEPLRDDIDEIDKAAQMGADITAQLLDLSRRRVLRTEILDVQEVVSAMEPMLRRLIAEDIILETHAAADASRIEADRSQIEQILLNLVVNARDALHDGGEVRISTEIVDLTSEQAAKGLRLEPGPHVVITVTDNGSGIDPAVQDRIFEPFFTTRQGGGSTGLGLSTVYGIVSHYNGHIAVQSHPGIGTTFRIYLPAVTEPAVPIARARAADRWLTGSETVLLVEDDAGIRRLTKRALENNGYRVLEAAGPTEALSIAELVSGEIELLLTDVVMPRMGGRELAHALGRLRPAIRVLYISGFTGEALARFGDLAWFEDFLAKPFRPEALLTKVREVLNRTEPHSATP
jgi:PAS domain S-box-containing protein